MACLHTPSTTFNLQPVQNLAARIITRTPRRQYITPVLRDLHWLPIERHIEYKITLYALRNVAPTYIQELVEENSPARTLRSNNRVNLVAPRTRFIFRHMEETHLSQRPQPSAGTIFQTLRNAAPVTILSWNIIFNINQQQTCAKTLYMFLVR